MSAPARHCPLCDETTELAFCPTDRMATLLVHTFTVRPPLPEPGTIIAGRYEIICPIGQGGHSAVFSARHLGTGQEVALKIMQPPHDADESIAVKRFFLEARVTSALKHPNTVRVFDFGQDDTGLVFLALELLSGRTLKRAIKERKNEERAFNEPEAIEIAVAISKSLIEAHAAGLVHRDLKPENVFLHEVSADERVVKVLDFGIAKLGGGHPTLTTPTSAPGTPAYMSPEQALSGEVDPRSDIYALGVILYHLMTGTLPFPGASDPEILYGHAYRAPPDVRKAAKHYISEAFAQLVERALAKDPAARFQSAAALKDALLACKETPAKPLERRSRAPAIGIAIALLVAAALSFALRAPKVEEKPAVVAAPVIEHHEPEPEPELAPVPVPVPVPDPERQKPKQKTRTPKREDDILHQRIEDLVPTKK